MATASKREVTKTRMVEEEYTEVDGVTLELTQKEAHMLTALVGFHTGGANEQIMDMYKALKSQISTYGVGVQQANMKMSGMVQVQS